MVPPQAETEAFPIKVFGWASDDFDAVVVSIVRRHCPELAEGAVRTQHSRGGRYMSVTVTVRTGDRARLDAIYRDLNASSRVLMTL